MNLDDIENEMHIRNPYFVDRKRSRPFPLKREETEHKINLWKGEIDFLDISYRRGSHGSNKRIRNSVGPFRLTTVYCDIGQTFNRLRFRVILSQICVLLWAALSNLEYTLNNTGIMDIKKAAAEYEVQMQNAIRAHRKCQEMARKEEAIERQIKDCTREVEEKMAWIRDAQARLAASKERHRIALEELQKTVPLASQSPSQVKQEQQVAAAPSPVAAGASSSVRTRSRKRNIGAVAPDSPTAESRRHGGTF